MICRHLAVAAMLLIVVNAAHLTAADAPASVPRSTVSPHSDALDLAVWEGNRLVHWQLHVEIDGVSAAEQWNNAFGQLFDFADRNHDGHLDRKEIERLPSAFGVRQVLWGSFTPSPGHAPTLEELDLDGNGEVSREELADYYRRHGLGGVLVAVGRPPATDALTNALLKNLARDGSKVVGEKDWLAAAESLRVLDLNDDEMIGPGELVPHLNYPGAAGTTLLMAPTAADKSSPGMDVMPILVLPARTADVYWASDLVRRRDRDGDGRLDLKESGLSEEEFRSLDSDHDGKLTPEELVPWRRISPARTWTIRLGKRRDGQSMLEENLVKQNRKDVNVDRYEASFGQHRLALRADEGKLPGLWNESRKRLVAQFADADSDHSGAVGLTMVDKPSFGELRALVGIANYNGDEKLTEKELIRWLEVQEQFAHGHVLVTVLDFGNGLFELLDADHDGAISVHELRGAWRRLMDAGCVVDGSLDRGRLPRQLQITISRGHPRSALAKVVRRGPAWFQAMDRNGDGVVSRREFLGTAEDFKRLDRDGDGLITPEEAELADTERKPRP